MDIANMIEVLKTSKLQDLNIRVTFYARVSSEKDEQLNSLDNQIKYYSNYIKSNKNWSYVDGYIDEGLSGISTKKRENFNRMIADAKLGKFDLIITKEISRFARNTLDSLKYTRDLLSYGVAVLYENDNLDTLAPDGELRLTIMSSLAQDELRKLSSRIKFGHRQAIENGVVLGNSRIFGYKKENKRLVIDEDEAQMVKELFELYATDKYSMKQIENIFWEKGYRNHNGNKIAHSTMSNTISNPKYKGYYVGRKVEIVDMFTKKQKFLPPEQWVMFKDETGDIVPAIVSEELWEQANTILRKRSTDVKNRQNKCNHPNLFTGKLICTNCGRPYYRKDSKDKHGTHNRWVCSGKINNGKDSCNSITIYEEDLQPILLDVFNVNSESIDTYISNYLDIFKEQIRDKNSSKEIEKLEKKIKLETEKKNKLLEYNISGKLTEDDYLSMNKRCNDEILMCKEALSEIKEKEVALGNLEERLKNFKLAFKRAKSSVLNDRIVDKDFVDTFIDKIFVTPVDNTTMDIKVKLCTGEVVDKSLNKAIRINGSSGHIIKKMIESYENSIK